MWANLVRLVRHRGLVQTLVVRDLKARYRGSVLGFFWSFANPLLLLLVYTFVFSVVLDGFRPVDIEPYALFLFCGLLPWTWFSSGLTEAGNSLVANGNLIKKVLFPAEVLPVVAVVANMVHFLLALPILVAALILLAPAAPRLSELVWFPIVVGVQLLLTLGLGLFLAALTVHFRDIKDLLSNVLTLWFFATPIIYPMAAVAGRGPEVAGLAPLGKVLMDLNPFAHLAISYQEILFYDGPFGHWKWLLVLGAGGAVLFMAAYAFFDRLRDSFAEEV
ncbi:MAG: ABC transporter permease [Acidobacteria bacterium]|nr:ABC transporter permease [Acidobacteriota bacterium]